MYAWRKDSNMVKALFSSVTSVSAPTARDDRAWLRSPTAGVGRPPATTGRPVLATYKEIESGKRADRPELARAIAHAKRSGATLVVAKLDRLSRNAAFLLTLQASGLPMVFLDLPGANVFTVGVMALV